MGKLVDRIYCGMNYANHHPCPQCGTAVTQGRSYCKPCRAAYLRARRHLGLHKYDSNATVTARRHTAKAQAIEMMGGKCNRCGWAPASAVQFSAMHFHHPSRDRTWKDFGFGTRSPEAIAAEVAKCELLCVRCHVLEHAGEKDNKPGRPRKEIDALTQAFIDQLTASK